ncbi:MAG: hypothetical protein LEGION0398_MBIBDBAK_00848 [Legionellaceae bacterium]
MSKTALELKHARQKLARAKLGLARERYKVRQVDTRRKIELGGLIVKAKLDEESSSVILGLLMEAKEKLHDVNGEKFRQQWQIKGQREFEKSKNH